MSEATKRFMSEDRKTMRRALADVLRAERIQLGVTTTELARRCGFGGADVVAHAETRGPALHLAKSLCDGLGVPLWSVIKRAEEIYHQRRMKARRGGGDDAP